MKLLGYLNLAQEYMKRFADLKRIEQSFEIRDFVYLRLQPYCQHSMVAYRNSKLSPRFYGPYKILERIESVAYRLDLPLPAKVHPKFHVSFLKKRLGQRNVLCSSLPSIASDEAFKSEPEHILELGMVQHRRHAETEVLIHWKRLPAKEASSVNYQNIASEFPDLVGKVF